MYKRMLRSALAVVFSTVVAYGALGGGVGSGGTGAVVAGAADDTGWTIAPTGTKADTGWNSLPETVA